MKTSTFVGHLKNSRYLVSSATVKLYSYEVVMIGVYPSWREALPESRNKRKKWLFLPG